MEFSALLPIALAERSPDVLARALDAWEKVDFPKDAFELVLCCDGPDPRVAGLVHGRSLRIRVVSQPAGGQSAATNRAARHARGERLLFSAQDVIPDPGLLKGHAAGHAAHPGAAILGALPYPHELPVTPFMAFLIDGGPQFAYPLFRHDREIRPHRLYAPNFSLDRQRFEALGGFREDLPYGCQDSDLGLRLHEAGAACFYRADAIGYHWHPHTLDGYAERQVRCGRSLVKLFRLHPRHGNLAQLRSGAVSSFLTARTEVGTWRRRALALEALPPRERERWWARLPQSPFGGPAYVPALPFLYDRVVRFHLFRGVHDQLCEDEGPEWPDRHVDRSILEIPEGGEVQLVRHAPPSRA